MTQLSKSDPPQDGSRLETGCVILSERVSASRRISSCDVMNKKQILRCAQDDKL
jgi:hypothetical protein